MSELYGPFNSGTGSNFDETQWRELLGNLFPPGVIKGAKVSGSAGGDMAVTASGSNMILSIATGCAIVYGFGYENTASASKTIGASDPSLKRIDTVVLKLDFSARTVLLGVHAGTLASSPVAPTLTQSSTTWEVPLCDVFVGNGVTTLSSGNLTDRRVFTGSIPPLAQGPGSLLNADLLDGATTGPGGGLDADTLDGTQLAGILVLGNRTSVMLFIGPSTPSNVTKWNVWLKTPFS